MSLTGLSRTAAGLVAAAAAIASASPAGANLYRTDWTASAWQVLVNDVPTEDSMCLWFTYSTPDANKDHVVATNMSVGPMYATINSMVKAFESHNCEPWTRVA